LKDIQCRAKGFLRYLHTLKYIQKVIIGCSIATFLISIHAFSLLTIYGEEFLAAVRRYNPYSMWSGEGVEA
jgi:hypothetical protein